jgi:Ser/Thr protein kinase RdoA (MazF antagonist)
VMDAATRRVTVACDTSTERLYFKGLTPRRCAEAVVTRAAQALMPDCYAPTLDWCQARAWWLTAKVKGAPLAQGLNAARLLPLVLALARTHRTLSAHLKDWQRIGVPADDVPEWLDLARWLLQRIAKSPPSKQSLQLSEHTLTSIEQMLGSVASASTSSDWHTSATTLLHNDLRIGNVFHHDGGMAFVDLELSSIGNPLIDLLVFLASFGSLTSAEHHELARAYCEAWPARDGVRLKRALSTAPGFLALSGVAQRVRPLRDKWDRLPEQMRRTLACQAFAPFADLRESV